MSLLEVRDIDVAHGDVQAVWNVSFVVEQGEVVTLIGANGAGKSTIMRALSGLIIPRRGRIIFAGSDVTELPPHARVARGLVLIPEGRQLWPGMTVLENLEMGAYARSARSARAEALAAVFALFPLLERRAAQKAGTLSGGEQQMCAIGRGLMARPRLLLLDEPALGLAPLLVRDLFATLRRINGEGITLLLVEQNVRQALALAARAHVLERGRLTLSGDAGALARDPRVRQEYLGA
jgi:branched-chain amino acid transport system ATP-binding protein